MDLRQYYTLFQAYDQLGRHLYGDSIWTGTEIDREKLRPPEEIKAERAPIEARIHAIDEEVKNINDTIARIVDSAKIETATAKRTELLKERSEFQNRLFNMWDADERYAQSYEARRRREVTEKRLLEALKQGKLQAIFCRQTILPNYVWQGERGFRYYLDLSIAVVPNHVSAIRRGAVFVKKDEFHRWLDNVIPEIVHQTAVVDPRQRCRWFLLQAMKEGNEKKLKTKAEYREEAMKLIPGLSERAFNAEWHHTVPESWRGRGRPKGK